MNSEHFQKFWLDSNAVMALTQQESIDDQKVVLKVASLKKSTRLYIIKSLKYCRKITLILTGKTG
jgi:hypothetical protein